MSKLEQAIADRSALVGVIGLGYIEATAEQIAFRHRQDQLIVLESTTYPRTTRDAMLPILEMSGLHSGTDFFVADSLQREDPENPKYTAGNIPKVVGENDAQSLFLAASLDGAAVQEVVPASFCR